MPFAYGSLLLVTVMEAALGLSDIPLQVTADYPPGCYGGPGPGNGSTIYNMLAPSCIYNMKGYTIDGVHREVGGMILNTNRPGHYGSLHMNVNLSTVPGTEKHDVLVGTKGWAHLSVGDETRDFWWNPAPGQNIYGPDPVEVGVQVSTIDSGTLPNNVSIWSSWDRLTGTANSDGLMLLFCKHECSSNVPNSRFYTVQEIRIEKVEGGWYYAITYAFRDDSRKIREYLKYVIWGYLQDVNTVFLNHDDSMPSQRGDVGEVVSWSDAGASRTVCGLLRAVQLFNEHTLATLIEARGALKREALAGLITFQ
ncbi:hypothetical protein Pmar_PMAR028844 [Perkinsus marinus ATCC 50983]|uniref:Uncharacterized protein n=1 Tax=Perkinsus marinus (strain ATCC 50983 / TXsc) TaxID=423536 RepID=C5LEH3_PERM5|nr:hypothetical protein Pmar_PMAR028844 [Perkinsus marinus ATCC 50983]EER04870.1 hypothetical protein Pmar_PMAR028844 [Perkinsus marinus ATCC 50983]|eukprot:XP_002773054.1 hypothetical protein Pmar_PMAR028844 [Perkinsus marinus ATCC 50983]